MIVCQSANCCSNRAIVTVNVLKVKTSPVSESSPKGLARYNRPERERKRERKEREDLHEWRGHWDLDVGEVEF